MNEIWKDVVGYEGLYKVSNMGQIYSLKDDKILKPTKHSIFDYMQIRLKKTIQQNCIMFTD